MADATPEDGTHVLLRKNGKCRTNPVEISKPQEITMFDQNAEIPVTKTVDEKVQDEKTPAEVEADNSQVDLHLAPPLLAVTNKVDTTHIHTRNTEVSESHSLSQDSILAIPVKEEPKFHLHLHAGAAAKAGCVEPEGYIEVWTAADDAITVDTVHLSVLLDSSMISPSHSLSIIKPKRGQKSYLLWKTEDGEHVEGCRAAANAPGVSIHMAPMRGDNGQQAGGMIGCKIQISLPAIAANGDNSRPISGDEAASVIDLVQEMVLGVGLNIDLRQLKVVRCDINRNIVLDEPYEKYEPVFTALKMPRSTTRSYRTGKLWGNKSHQLNVYCKSVERQAKGYSNNRLPENTIRLEYRVLSARSVRKKLQITNLQDLLDDWDALGEKFLSVLEKNLFQPRASDFSDDGPGLGTRIRRPVRSQIRSLLRWCRKHQLAGVPSSSKMEQILRSGGIDAYALAVTTIPGMVRKYANSKIRQMRDALWQEATTDASFAMRYHDLVMLVFADSTMMHIGGSAKVLRLETHTDTINCANSTFQVTYDVLRCLVHNEEMWRSVPTLIRSD